MQQTNVGFSREVHGETAEVWSGSSHGFSPSDYCLGLGPHLSGARSNMKVMGIYLLADKTEWFRVMEGHIPVPHAPRMVYLPTFGLNNSWIFFHSGIFLLYMATGSFSSSSRCLNPDVVKRHPQTCSNQNQSFGIGRYI